jgi:zinc transporter 1/2/3
MEESDSATELIIIKLLFIAFIFLVALIFGLVPYSVKSCSGNRTILSIANAFSGGIFLAIALLHIIPEAHTHYLVYLHKAAGDDHHHEGEGYSEIDVDIHHGVELGGRHRMLHGVDGVHEFLELGFPLPYFMVFIGYAFILLIDKVIFDSHSAEGGHDHFRDSIMKSNRDSIHSRQRSNSQNEVNGVNFYNQKYNEFNDEDDGTKNDDAVANGEGSGEKNEDISEGIRQYLSKADRFSARMSEALSKKYTRGQHKSREIDLATRMRSNTGDPTASERKFFNRDHESSSQTSPNDMASVIILMVALSTHSVFEGIAVGLQDDVTDIWNFLVAIGLHKWAAAMSLGISMSSNLENNKNFVRMLITVFASATPLGILIGMLVMDAPPLVNIIFSGLAGGTFLYISASEVVVEEFSIPKNKWIKMCGFVLGALVIAFVTSIEE